MGARLRQCAVGWPGGRSGSETVSMLTGNRNCAGSPPTAAELCQVRAVDDEPAYPHGRAQALQPIPELDGVGGGHDEHGLAHPHDSGAVDEPGCSYVAGRPSRVVVFLRPKISWDTRTEIARARPSTSYDRIPRALSFMIGPYAYI